MGIRTPFYLCLLPLGLMLSSPCEAQNSLLWQDAAVYDESEEFDDDGGAAAYSTGSSISGPSGSIVEIGGKGAYSGGGDYSGGGVYSGGAPPLNSTLDSLQKSLEHTLGKSVNIGDLLKILTAALSNNPDNLLKAIMEVAQKFGITDPGFINTFLQARQGQTLTGGNTGTNIGGVDLDTLRNAIMGQESGGDPSAVNPHSGALGLYQVMPENVGPWSEKVLGRRVSTEEFLSNPELQTQIVNGVMGDMLERAMEASGGNVDEAIRRVASEWYSGKQSLYNNTRPQTYAGASYPSINDYTLSVLDRYKSSVGSANLSPSSYVSTPYVASSGSSSYSGSGSPYSPSSSGSSSYYTPSSSGSSSYYTPSSNSSYVSTSGTATGAQIGAAAQALHGSDSMQGQCLAGVWQSLQRAGIVSGYDDFYSTWGSNPKWAKYAGPTLERLGFQNVGTSIHPNNAPVGSICVYGPGNGTHPAGHIEIKTAQGWVSDGFISVPACDWNTPRTLIGVYLPPA